VTNGWPTSAVPIDSHAAPTFIGGSASIVVINDPENTVPHLERSGFGAGHSGFFRLQDLHPAQIIRHVAKLANDHRVVRPAELARHSE
jgi:hypothetical protein